MVSVDVKHRVSNSIRRCDSFTEKKKKKKKKNPKQHLLTLAKFHALWAVYGSDPAVWIKYDASSKDIDGP